MAELPTVSGRRKEELSGEMRDWSGKQVEKVESRAKEAEQRRPTWRTVFTWSQLIRLKEEFFA